MGCSDAMVPVLIVNLYAFTQTLSPSSGDDWSWNYHIFAEQGDGKSLDTTSSFIMLFVLLRAGQNAPLKIVRDIAFDHKNDMHFQVQDKL